MVIIIIPILNYIKIIIWCFYGYLELRISCKYFCSHKLQKNGNCVFVNKVKLPNYININIINNNNNNYNTNYT